MQIKEFNSKDYGYQEENLKQFLPLFSAYVNIALDENEVVELTDLLKPLPNKDSVEYAKISCIKNIDELISDNARCFVLYEDNKPVSLALFSKDNSLAKYHLELVYTAKKMQNKGYGKKILLESFKALKEDAFCVSANVNSSNFASQGLNASLKLPYATQGQSFDNPGDSVFYYYHIINPEMLQFINKIAGKERPLLYLANNIGKEEYDMLKNMMAKEQELEKE